MATDGPTPPSCDSEIFKKGVDDSPAAGAVVREVDGQLVLDDPMAVAVMRAVAKHNCRNTLELNADRVAHFKRRLVERGMTPVEAVIVLLNVDNPYGAVLADVLMPSYDWASIRAKGEVPFARGLAGRDGIQAAIEDFDKEAGAKLAAMKCLAVVVVDHGVAEIFQA